MHYDKQSLSIVEDNGDCTVCLKCYTFFKNYESDTIINLIEPLVIHGDNWDISSSISFRTDQYEYHTIQLELLHADTQRKYNGIWSATLVGLDDTHNMKLSTYTLGQKLKMSFRMSNRMLYLIAMNSIVTFDVKIFLLRSS